jgi:hypothetical protein
MKRPICILIALASLFSLAAAQGKKLNTPQPVTFAPATSVPGTVSETGIASGDLTNNGIQDLVITDYHGGFFTALGNGDGTFHPFNVEGGTAIQLSVVVADINEDGKLDFVIPDGAASNVDLFRGNGEGGSNADEAVYAGPLACCGFPVNAVAVGDLRRNGIADVVFTNSGAYGPGNDVGVLLGKGKGEFEHQVLYHSGGQDPNTVIITDVNVDGVPDLLVGNFPNTTGIKSTVGVLLGNGDGTFQAAKVTNIDCNGICYTPTDTLIAGDFNGDGKPDIAVMLNGGVAIFLGKGDGTFTTPGNFYQVGCGTYGGVVADFNGDGVLDLALVGNCAMSYVSVLVGNGDGTFQPAARFAVGLLPVQLTVADFNGDGKPDIATVNYLSQDISILLNTTP